MCGNKEEWEQGLIAFPHPLPLLHATNIRKYTFCSPVSLWCNDKKRRCFLWETLETVERFFSLGERQCVGGGKNWRRNEKP